MLYERAIEAGEYDEYCAADVKFRLGKCYLYGIGTDKDAQLALQNLTDALNGFYQRKMTDVFVDKLIQGTKKMISETMDILDNE